MPSWNIHLEAGERLADKMSLTGDKRREFLFGCLLPDINNGYINHPDYIKDHSDTHYAYDQKSSLNFYAENPTEIQGKVPIFLGYLLHLYTDGYFNYHFYRTIKRSPLGAGLTHAQKSDIKHHDFWLYDTKFHHELDIAPSDYAKYAEKANALPRIKVTEHDVAELAQIMHDDTLNDHVEGDNYWFYTESELDDLIARMIEGFTEQYLGENYA